jgi:hypothetical protein
LSKAKALGKVTPDSRHLFWSPTNSPTIPVSFDIWDVNTKYVNTLCRKNSGFLHCSIWLNNVPAVLDHRIVCRLNASRLVTLHCSQHYPTFIFYESLSRTLFVTPLDSSSQTHRSAAAMCFVCELHRRATGLTPTHICLLSLQYGLRFASSVSRQSIPMSTVAY